MKRAVIIVAGGKGTRFGAEVPKQFLLLGEMPIYLHTIHQFIKYDATMQVVLVLPSHFTPSELQEIKDEVKGMLDIEVACCNGGVSRFYSVKNGLALLQDGIEVVGIHDAVRPLVSQATIDRVYYEADKHGNAIPTLPLKNSIRKLQDGGSQAVDRSQYRLVQTPQCFQKQLLVNAYAQEDKGFTDDASVLEAAGYAINIVEGNQENIKITTPPDLKFAEYILETY